MQPTSAGRGENDVVGRRREGASSRFCGRGGRTRRDHGAGGDRASGALLALRRRHHDCAFACVRDELRFGSRKWHRRCRMGARDARRENANDAL